MYFNSVFENVRRKDNILNYLKLIIAADAATKCIATTVASNVSPLLLSMYRRRPCCFQCIAARYFLRC
jgi:hypothetical protein